MESPKWRKGIVIVSSSNVMISDSLFETADDAICLKTVDLEHRGDRPVKPVENVVVMVEALRQQRVRSGRNLTDLRPCCFRDYGT